MPSGIKKDELLFAYIGGDYAASGAVLSTATSGWETILSHGNSTSDCYQAIMWKIASGPSEADLVVTSSVSQQMCAIVRRIKDTHLTEPIAGYYNYTGDSKFAQYMFRPRQYEDKCIHMTGISGDGSDTAPSYIGEWGAGNQGWTLDTYAQSIPTSINGVGITLGFNATSDVATFDRHTAVSTGGITFWNMLTTDSSVGVQMIIRPRSFAGETANLCQYSAELVDNTAGDTSTYDRWYISSAATATYDQTGMDGVANHATLLTDGSSSQENRATWTFQRNSETHHTMPGVARIFIKKEGTATVVPQIQLRDATTNSATPSGDNIAVQLETELGTLFEVANSLPSGAYEVRTADASDVVGDWWEIILEGTFLRNPQIVIYPDRHVTYGGVSSQTPIGACTVGNVELYLNATADDIRGTVAKYNRPSEDMAATGLLIRDKHLGTGYAVKTGQRPEVTPTGSEVWVSPGSGLDAITTVVSSGTLRTQNFTDWAVIDAGQANITVNQRFGCLLTSTRGIYVGCRFDALGNNGYMAAIEAPFTANPLLTISKCTANAFGTKLAQVDLGTGASTWKDFDMSISTDTDEIVASCTFAEPDGTLTTKSVTYVTTDLNTNTSAMIGMYATSGDILVLGYNDFTVWDYSP
jgi:hypothetical protein